MNKLKYVVIPVIGIALILGSCADFLKDQIRDKDVLNNYLTKDTEAAIFLYGGIYNLRSVYRDGRNFLSVYELPTDQTFYGNNNSDAARRQLGAIDYATGNLHVQNVWQGLFQCISQMNILIDNLEGADYANSKYAPRVNAQARFYRAWSYFDAVRLWGEVPLTKSYYSTQGILAERSPIPEVYAQIVADLEFCLEGNRLRENGFDAAGKRLMPDTVKFKYPYDTEALGENYFLPISKGAAKLLLAKVLLTRNESGDHARAEEIVTEMIGNPQYRLLPNYGDLFDQATKGIKDRYREVLFEYEVSAEAGTNNTAHREIGPSTEPGANTGIKPRNATPLYPNNDTRGKRGSGYHLYRPTEYFLAWFDGMKDKRYFWTFQFFYADRGPNYQKGRDEQQADHNDNGYCNNVLLRFADAYLIKAELRARAGDLAGMKAAMKPVLDRAGLDFDEQWDYYVNKNLITLTSQSNVDDLVNFILMERAKEFTLEAGNRLFDLRRTKSWGAALARYDKWYEDNIVNSTRIFPYSGGVTNIQNRVVYQYMNPACNGKPIIVPVQTDGTNRQDQNVGGDYFEITVPFMAANASNWHNTRKPKEYYPKMDFHPIPARELNVNPNLNNNLHVENWN